MDPESKFASVHNYSSINWWRFLTRIEAGFNYEFRALNPSKGPTEHDGAFESDKCSFRANTVAFTRLWCCARDSRFCAFCCLLRSQLWGMDRIGTQRLHDAEGALAFGEKDAGRRDLLSPPVQSNMSEKTPESNRLSGIYIYIVVVGLAQVPTVIAAGHETTSDIYTVIRTFEFELYVPREAIGGTRTPVQRPCLIPKLEKGHHPDAPADGASVGGIFGVVYQCILNVRRIRDSRVKAMMIKRVHFGKRRKIGLVGASPPAVKLTGGAVAVIRSTSTRLLAA
ncbi:hypothetical protein B0H13DRAFT_1881882 [Mycena leptocephala]|nr:hypothetical protein B0H13DRAFT_1881882 [Mycena leptocephala]